MKMQKIVAFIPNLFTLGNLFCGCLAIIFAFEWRLDWAAYMVFLAAFLDFFDGFFARLLKVSGELGKQLDSLADMVSFGVVPGIVMFKVLTFASWLNNFQGNEGEIYYNSIEPVAILGLVIPVFSCYRLAKFNIDTRQSHGFIGLPTPANAIFFCSFALVIFNSFHHLNTAENFTWSFGEFISSGNTFTPTAYMADIWTGGQMLEAQGGSPLFFNHLFWLAGHSHILNYILNLYLLVAIIILFSLLLVSPIPLFALKFKNFGWNDNKIRYIFLVLAVGLLIVFQLVAIPFIVILYILISIINNIFKITA